MSSDSIDYDDLYFRYMTHGGYTHKNWEQKAVKYPSNIAKSTAEPIMKESKITKLLKEKADKANEEHLNKWAQGVVDSCMKEAQGGEYKLVVSKLGGPIDSLAKRRHSKLKQMGLNAEFEDTKNGIALVVKW